MPDRGRHFPACQNLHVCAAMLILGFKEYTLLSLQLNSSYNWKHEFNSVESADFSFLELSLKF